jgi:hypothetical protein
MGTSSGPVGAFQIRRAEPSDVDEIALAHRDSIQSIGPAFYSPDVVAYWQEAIAGEPYLEAMAVGEVFFMAVGDADGTRVVLGFASDYCVEGPKHGTSVYVRGRAPRRRVVRPCPQRRSPRRLERCNDHRNRGIARWRRVLPG